MFSGPKSDETPDQFSEYFHSHSFVVIGIRGQTSGSGGENDSDPDVRFGHQLNEIQDAIGVDLGLLRVNLKLPVEERLLALEEMIEFARVWVRSSESHEL